MPRGSRNSRVIEAIRQNRPYRPTHLERRIRDYVVDTRTSGSIERIIHTSLIQITLTSSCPQVGSAGTGRIPNDRTNPGMLPVVQPLAFQAAFQVSVEPNALPIWAESDVEELARFPGGPHRLVPQGKSTHSR